MTRPPAKKDKGATSLAAQSHSISAGEASLQNKSRTETERTLRDQLKVAGLTISVIFVAGIATWLTAGDGTKYILNWFQSAKIEVASAQRLAKDNFWADEKIRFSLQNVNSERVFWVFDEKITQVGNVETEYAFSLEPNQPMGSISTHRVDVFFKDGANYKAAATIWVRVQNISFSSAMTGK